MKLTDIFEAEDVEDEFPNLKDLSKHQFNIKICVSKYEIEKISDEDFSKLIEDIQDDTKDDFIVWHYWEDNYYVFDVAGTTSWQALADVTDKLRKAYKIRNDSVTFFKSQKVHKLNDLYNGMRYYSAHELSVKL